MNSTKYPVIKTTSNTNSLLNSVSNNNTQSFINPVRTDASYNSVLSYNSTTKEITKGGYISNTIKSNALTQTFHCGSHSNNTDATAISAPIVLNGVASGTSNSAIGYSNFGLSINSYYGTGFVDTYGTICKTYINHRNGDINTKGRVIFDISNFPPNVPIFVGNFNSDGTSTCYNAVSNTTGGTGSANVVSLARTSGAYDLIFPNFTLSQPAVSISTQTPNITYTWSSLGNGIRCTFRNLAGTTIDAYFCIIVYKII